MNNSSTLASTAYPAKPTLWQWLLRSTGLEAWFQQAPAAEHAGQQACLLLLLTLADTTRATRTAHAAVLAEALRTCAASLEASGGEVISYQPGALLLAWPVAAGLPTPPVAALYAELRASVRRLAASPALGLNGAAGLGWVAPGSAPTAQRYDKASLREVAGILHESQQLGSELLLTAALHQQLASTLVGQCTLHVAFEVPGHRYPATLYRVALPASA